MIHLQQIVNRALSFAMSDPKGPVYLYGAREAMEEDITHYALNQSFWNPVEPTALPLAGAKVIAEALSNAQEPLVIVGYSGRNHAAVDELVKLANTVKGLRVLDTGGSDMCFPADHRGWLGCRFGNDESIKTADVILVADCDIPWINTQCKPKPDAKIYHVDVDPLKQQMPVFYLDALARYRADSATAFAQIREQITASEALRVKAETGPEALQRWERLGELYKKKLDTIRDLAVPGSDGTFGCSYLMSRVRHFCPEDTIWAIEAVTNTQFVADQIQAKYPGSWINCGGGGLGWSGGGTLGIKLGTDDLGQKRFVCQVVGDGTYLFTVPASVYWIAQRYKIPILTIVLNNKGWNAPRRSLLLVHPDGEASKVSNEELNISFAPTPDYSGIAKAASGGEVWAAHASTVDELEQLLPQAVQIVLSGRSAVLDAHLEGPQGKYGGGKTAVNA